MGVCLPRDKHALLTRDVYRARRTTRTAAESVDNWHFYWMKVFITPSLSIGGPLGCHTLTISWAKKKKKKKRKKFGIVFVMQYSCFLQRGEKFVSREREKAGFSGARQELGNAGCIWAFEKVICGWPLNLRHLLFLLFFFFERAWSCRCSGAVFSGGRFISVACRAAARNDSIHNSGGAMSL